MAFSLSRNERVYVQKQPSLLTIPNTAGAATVAVANYLRHKKAMLDPQIGMLTRPDKTGWRTATQGVAGRKFAQWSLDLSLAGSGVASTAPPADAVLEALFGQAASVVAGSGAITGATNASPIVITQTGHGFANNDVVRVTGVGGNTAANSVWVAKNVTANTYELAGSSGNGAYTSGGTGSRAGVRYTLADLIPFFAMYSFLQPSTAEQRCGFGCVVNEATFQLGQDVADWQTSGEAAWVLDSHNFSTSDAIAQGGLSAFPTEPAGALPSDGGIIAGFTGRAVVAASTIANIRQSTIRVSTGNALVRDTFGSYYADSAEGDERNVNVSFSVHHADDAGTKALMARALDKSPIEMIFQLGTGVGNTWLFHLQGVQLNQPKLDDGQRRFVRSYSDCRAHGSSPSALDEVRLTIL